MPQKFTDPRLPEVRGLLPSLGIKFFIAFLIFGTIPTIIFGILLMVNFHTILNYALAMSVAHGIDQGQRLNEMTAALRVKEVIAIIVLLILPLLGAITTSRFFFRPLHKLLHGIDEVSKGNLSTIIVPEDNDEVGQLTQQFNIMTLRLKESREREDFISQTKSEFISIAAHQLRTPLSGVKWSMKLLMDGDVGILTKEQKKLLLGGYQANERMILIVSDLLDVSRIEEGRFGFIFKKADLVPIIKEMVDEVSSIAKNHKINLETDMPKPPIPWVFVDAERLKLALSNLIANAINYTLPGGHVTVGLRQEGSAIRIFVRDTGVGVPHAQMPKLFTKFFRGENVKKIQTEGSGLGLFIVKNIVERHNGEMHVESEEGKGSTFSFTLPIRESEMPQQEASMEQFLKEI